MHLAIASNALLCSACIGWDDPQQLKPPAGAPSEHLVAPWLAALLQARFFVTCQHHPDGKRGEV